MNRKDFSKLLDSTILPEGSTQEETNIKIHSLCQALIKMLPDKLYRYRSCSQQNIDTFDTDIVYCVTADKFNDPYDALPCFNLELLKPFWGQKEYEEIQSQISDTLRKVSTLACFTETINSITMWSHYAQEHQGFALEYDLRYLLYEGASTLKSYIFPIIYSDIRYDSTSFVCYFILKLLGIEVTQNDVFANLKMELHKSTQWEYEKEWRLINWEVTLPPPYQSHAIGLNIVPKAIYYGERISKIERIKLHHIAKQKEIKEYDMYIDNKSLKYEMLYKPSLF